MSLPAPYWIRISSNSGDITPNKSVAEMLFFLSSFLAADTVLSTLDVVKAIPLPAVPQIVPSSTVESAFEYSPNTSESTWFDKYSPSSSITSSIYQA